MAFHVITGSTGTGMREFAILVVAATCVFLQDAADVEDILGIRDVKEVLAEQHVTPYDLITTNKQICWATCAAFALL